MAFPRRGARLLMPLVRGVELSQDILAVDPGTVLVVESQIGHQLRNPMETRQVILLDALRAGEEVLRLDDPLGAEGDHGESGLGGEADGRLDPGT